MIKSREEIREREEGSEFPMRFIALSYRTRKRLRRKGFDTLEHVASLSEGALLEIYGFDREMVDELRGVLKARGMTYREETR